MSDIATECGQDEPVAEPATEPSESPRAKWQRRDVPVPDPSPREFKLSKRLKTGLGTPRRSRNGIDTCTYSGLPVGCHYIARKLVRLKNQLYDAIVAVRGSVSLSHAALLQSIVRSERAALLYERVIGQQGVDPVDSKCQVPLSLNAMDTALKGLLKAIERRDKLILMLGIDKNEMDVFSSALTEDPSADLRDAGIVIDVPKDDEDRGAV